LERPLGVDRDRTSGAGRDSVEQIQKLHHRDPEIRYMLARVRRAEGSNEEALSLLNHAAEFAELPPHGLVLRSELRQLAGDVRGAAEDASAVLRHAPVLVELIRRAITVIRRTD